MRYKRVWCSFLLVGILVFRLGDVAFGATYSEVGEESQIAEEAILENQEEADEACEQELQTEEETVDAEATVNEEVEVTALTASTTSITYSAYLQDNGWLAQVSDGAESGTTGQSLRLEGIQIQIAGNEELSVRYRSYVENYGWESDWAEAGETSGKAGKGLRMEAIQVELTGSAAEQYDVYYRVHGQNMGWIGWAKNGETAGSSSYGRRIEALQVVLVEKGGEAPGSTDNPYVYPLVRYGVHCQNKGWMDAVYDQGKAGTSGQGLRLEAIKIATTSPEYSSSVTYRTHVQNYGWMSWKSNDEASGTSGKGLRMEAIQIKLTGEMAEQYDIYYRTHVQNYGWLAWAKNGEESGTSSLGLRLECIQIVLVEKGGEAPADDGDSSSTYIEGPLYYSIMGSSTVTVAQMVAQFQSTGKTYPSSTYSSKGAGDIKTFCTILKEEAEAEGVRAEVLFAQAMLETGYLQFGGDVKASQCNFGGIGATGGGVAGNTFSDVRTGLRAQVQHLKAYASTAALNQTCVDPRFNYVKRGCAPYVEWLGIQENPYGYGWASGAGYGSKILAIIKQTKTR